MTVGLARSGPSKDRVKLKNRTHAALERVKDAFR
jgi:hypothetical protein